MNRNLTKEKFIETVIDCGMSKERAELLWSHRPLGVDIDEEAVRLTTAVFAAYENDRKRRRN